MATETNVSVTAREGTTNTIHASAEAGGQSTGSVLAGYPASQGDRLVIAVVRHKYDGRLYFPGQSYEMAADRVANNVHAGLVFDPARGSIDWWGAPGRVLAAEPADGAEPWSRAPRAGSLRIVQGVGYDPGSAAYRFHSAVNEHTQHASAFVRFEDSNPYCSLRQYDGDRDLATVRKAIVDADVVHCHVNYILLNNTGLRPKSGAVLIRHYHGSRPDGRSWVEQSWDDSQGALQVGARLSLLAESPRMQWLPITVPVARYRALRARVLSTRGIEAHARPLRIAHSPTKRTIKGTDAFLRACELLNARGLGIEPVLIEGLTHGDALALKASCDVTFDSFWLGIQGSGLEAGAMQMPVIAGDPDVARLYREHTGDVPYTYANSECELVETIERFATDPVWFASEAKRVAAYVEHVHDYPAVARRYEQMLAAALGRDDVLTPEPQREPLITHEPPTPTTPAAPPIETPTAKPVKTPRRRKPEVR